MGILGIILLGVVASGLEGLPDDLKRLEDLGKVTYSEYDPVREPRERPGHTWFQVDIDRKFTYRWRVEPSRRGGGRMTAELTMTTVEVGVTHRIELPEGRSLGDPAYRALVRHEYDHVAISADPRLRRLVEGRLGRPLTVERPVEQGQSSIEEWLEDVHRDDLERHVKAVTELVRHHYERLDALTDHGARPLPDRDAFFEALYAPEALREAGYDPAETGRAL